MREIKKVNTNINVDKLNIVYDKNRFKDIAYYNEKKNNNVVENLDLGHFKNNNKKISKEKVIDAIELNLSNNKKMTDFFNQELYKRVNEEIVNLSRGEEDLHRASGR